MLKLKLVIYSTGVDAEIEVGHLLYGIDTKTNAVHLLCGIRYQN